MLKIFRNRLFLQSLIVFILLNIALYAWMDNFNKIVPFSSLDYTKGAYHYEIDPRVNSGSFSLLNALGQYDSQWHLKIAGEGYQSHPIKLKGIDKGVSYIFFPAFPIIVSVLNLMVKNLELSAFIVTNTLLLLNFLSLYFVVSKWFSKKVAIKTIFLLFLFPFSIFFRSYYVEGLKLLFFIWFCFGIKEKKYFISAISLGFFTITNAISLFLLPYFLILIYSSYKKRELLPRKLFAYALIAVLPFCFWMGFSYIQTGNPLYFIVSGTAWYRPAIPILHNIALLFLFPFLSLRSVYGSQIDVLAVVLTIIIAGLSKKMLPFRVWLATVILAFTPLFLQDTISFARFTSVLFPFFAYLAYKMNNKYYFLCIFIFILGLLATSLLFINWYWIE